MKKRLLKCKAAESATDRYILLSMKFLQGAAQV